MPEASSETLLLRSLEESFLLYVKHGARSTEKLRPLHRFLSEQIQLRLGEAYEVNSMSYGSNKEDKIEGYLYEKRVDISIAREGELVGGVAVKFVTSNYAQNANNYMENMLGETFNVRSSEFLYCQVLVLRNPLPYLKKGGKVKHMEEVKEHHLLKYKKLLELSQEQYGVPNLLFLYMVSIEEQGQGKCRAVPCSEELLSNFSDEVRDFYIANGNLDRFLEKLEGLVKAHK